MQTELSMFLRSRVIIKTSSSLIIVHHRQQQPVALEHIWTLLLCFCLLLVSFFRFRAPPSGATFCPPSKLKRGSFFNHDLDTLLVRVKSRSAVCNLELFISSRALALAFAHLAPRQSSDGQKRSSDIDLSVQTPSVSANPRALVLVDNLEPFRDS